jgi:hypothetical protein
MIRNLTPATVTFRAVNATAAGTTAINGASINTKSPQQFQGVRAVAGLGALTATQVTRLKLQGSNDNATWTDLGNTGSGYAADADSNKLLITETYRPMYPYIRPVVERGTANAVVDFVILELFLAAREPVTQDATVSQSKVTDYATAGTA